MNPYDLIISNVRVVRPGTDAVTEADIAVSGGVIARVAPGLAAEAAGAGGAGTRVVDGEGRLAFPGVVDAHQHWGIYNPLAEDTKTESMACAQGGVTTSLTYMRTGQYYMNTGGSYAEVFPQVLSAAEGKSYVDYAFHLAPMQSSHIDEIPALIREHGVSSFKIFMFYGSHGLHGRSADQNSFLMIPPGERYDLAHFEFVMRGVQKAREQYPELADAISLSLHCETAEIMTAYTKLVEQEGRLTGLQAYSASRPAHSEGLAVTIASYLAHETGLPNINLLHLSSAKALEAAMLMAKTFPHVNFRREVTIGHLLADYTTADGIGGKVNPPLRGRDDVEKLWEHVLAGDVSWVVSDHACCKEATKFGADHEDVFAAKSGFGGTEYLLPGLVGEGRKRGLPLRAIAELTAWNPAQRYGLAVKGDIAEGFDADIALVDPDRSWVVDPADSFSTQEYTPLRGHEIGATVTATFLRGQQVYGDGKILGDPAGRYLRRPVTARLSNRLSAALTAQHRQLRPPDTIGIPRIRGSGSPVRRGEAVYATRAPNSGMPDDIASLTARTGLRRWPWPRLWRSFRDTDPVIAELVTRDPAGQSARPDQVLATFRDAGIEVAAVEASADFPAAGSGGDIAPLVTLVNQAADAFSLGDRKLRFPRTRLLTYVAALDLSRPPSGEKVDDLHARLREYWARPQSDDARPPNILESVARAGPNPLQPIAALLAGLTRRNFHLWLWGVPGAGGECRWLRRQRRHAGNGIDFSTFLLRLTAEGRRTRPLDLSSLIARAFLEDLRVAFRPRLWRHRTWNRYRRPVLILDGLDNALPELFHRARIVTREQEDTTDPLLIVLVSRPAGERPPRSFPCQVVHEIGDPEQVAYQRPSRPRLALAASALVGVGVLALAAIPALRLSGALSVPPSPRVSAPRPPGSPGGRPAPGVLAAADCPDRTDGETDVVPWTDDAHATECVGFSGSSYVFTNPGGETNSQQRLQRARITYDQQQIHDVNAQIDAYAKTAAPGSPPAYEIVYFAGLTESPLDEYDSAEAEEMEGLLAAQRSVLGNYSRPQLKVIVANGGAKMQDARQVAQLIIKRFGGDRNFLGVVGLDRSTGDVRDAIAAFSAARVPVLATTLSADEIGGGSQYYFELPPANADEASLMLSYIQQVVPRYFRQPASLYPSGGSATARHIVVYQPDVSSEASGGHEDLYVSTLVNDLRDRARNYHGLPPLIRTENLNDPRLCGADTVDIYAGRHDRPLDSASASRNDDFTQFLQRIGECAGGMPFVIADDGIARFIADPADRANLDAGPLSISYVTKGLRVLSTGAQCLSEATASRVTAQPLAAFCRAYAGIATALRGKGITLLWTGERVGLAYDAAQMFLQAAEANWREGAAITRTGIPAAFENSALPYSLVTGSVHFTATSHIGADTPQGMPLAIVRIRVSDPQALPTCAFTGSGRGALTPIPNLDASSAACVHGTG